MDELLGGSPPQLASLLGYLHNELRRRDGRRGLTAGALTHWVTSGKSAGKPLCSASRVLTLRLSVLCTDNRFLQLGSSEMMNL